MNANDIIIQTPYDSIIARVSDVLDGTRYYYGDVAVKTRSEEKIKKSRFVAANSSATAKVQRAAYLNASKSGAEMYYDNSNELLADFKTKKVNLADLKEDELPEELKKLTPAQRIAFVEEKIQQRDSLQKVLNTLVRKRDSYITTELAKKDSTTVNASFNMVIYEKMKTQTKKKNINLKGKAKF
jgi:hypothetical protein